MLTDRDIDILAAAGEIIAPGDPRPHNYAAALGLLVQFAATDPIHSDVRLDRRRSAEEIDRHQIAVARAARTLRLAEDLAPHAKRILDLVEADYGGRGEIVAIADGLWGVRR